MEQGRSFFGNLNSSSDNKILAWLKLIAICLPWSRKHCKKMLITLIFLFFHNVFKDPLPLILENCVNGKRKSMCILRYF